MKNIKGLKENLGSVDSGLKAVISDALARSYVSVSSVQEYKTGNNYQSVALGDKQLVGYRTDRTAQFELFNFTGRSVLDCGCNLGELSRLARDRGARLVDGYEYDPFFVKIGQTINAYRGTQRVSFYERDLTDASIYVDSFDVTLAFSVYPYVLPVLDRIAEQTKEALIVETHDRIDLYQRYIQPISKYFPVHSYIATTDYGHGQGKRSIFVFAKRHEVLLPQNGLLNLSIDLAGARFGFVDPIFVLPGTTSPATESDLRQFSTELRDYPRDDLKKFTGGKAYWLQMIAGFLEYRANREIAADNSYVAALTEIMKTANTDHNLSVAMGTSKSIIQRVKMRFDDIDRMLVAGNKLPQVEPVRIVNPVDDAGYYMMQISGLGEKIFADDLDGYHRIFWASLLRLPRLPALFVCNA